MWDGFNKRKFPRVNLECEILIQSEDTSAPIKAVTQNVGQGGVCVLLERSLERFSRCQLKINLGGTKLKSEGKVVWIVPTKESKSARRRFDTGIEFVALSEDEKNRISEYLREQLKDAL